MGRVLNPALAVSISNRFGFNRVPVEIEREKPVEGVSIGPFHPGVIDRPSYEQFTRPAFCRSVAPAASGDSWID